MTFKTLNNRLHNCTNPYQGSDRRVLCLCSAGLLRSPTAANVLHQKFGYNTRAAGTSADFALIPVDEVLVAWAEEIVCMSYEQKEYVMVNFDTSNKIIINLDIPDCYSYNDAELKEIIYNNYVNT